MKLLLCILFSYLTLSIQAQVVDTYNYVPNGDFESYTSCPDNLGQICRVTFWDDACNCNGSSEYINSCSSDIIILQFISHQPPRSGNGYVGMALYTPNPASEYREYAQVELKNKLKQKKRYCAELYTNSHNYNKYVVGNISIYFSSVKDTDLLQAGIHIPQVKNHSGLLIDTVNWIKVAGTFIAQGDEQYMIIGNHETNANSTIQQVDYGLIPGYYFVDDVSVCECSFEFNLGSDTTLCPGETLTLHPQVLGAEFFWQDGSQGNTFTVTQSGTYWVKAYFKEYDFSSYDTIVVNYGDENYCAPALEIPNVITPNNDGINDCFVIGNSDYWDINLMVFNRWGNLVYQSTDYQNDFKCKECPQGTYFYLLKARAKRNKKEIERKGTLTILR